METRELLVGDTLERVIISAPESEEEDNKDILTDDTLLENTIELKQIIDIINKGDKSE